jgi:hypothetical protein
MDTAPGTRGIVIGDRYRVAGALRRTGLIDAVDLEADRSEAACRIVGVPGDAERVDAWEDAWRAAQGAACLPGLREIVADDDGAHWAVLDPAPSAVLPLPTDASAQARAIGEALAEAGLDVDDVTPAMLVTADDGSLCLDGVVWLGGERSARSAGRALADLLPRASGASADPPTEHVDWAPPRRRAPQRRQRRSRVLVPAAIIAVLAAAAAVLILPSRSGGTAVVAPGASVGSDDVLLGSAGSPLVRPEAIAVPAAEAAESEANPKTIATAIGADEQPPAETVTVVVTAPSAPVDDSSPMPVAAEPSAAPELPIAAAQSVPELPRADVVPGLPLAAGG